MKKLDEVIKWIEAADNHYFDVGDYGQNEAFVKSISAAQAQKEAGSVSNYFAKLAESGHPHIWVKWVTKTASGWNNRKGPVFSKIGSQTQNSPSMENGSMTPAPQYSPNGSGNAAVIPSENMGLGIPGLNFADVMELKADSKMGAWYKTQYEATLNELKDLKATYEALKDEKKDEAASEARTAQYLKLAEILGPAIVNILPGIKPPGATQPLNAPAENFSSTKNSLLDVIKDPGVNDHLCGILYNVIAFAPNKDFLNQLTQLINTQQNA